MDIPLYEERQGFAAWVWVLGAVTLVVTVAAIVAILPAEDAAIFLLAKLTPLVLVSGLVANIMFMTTRIHRDIIHVRFGWLLPMLWKRIPLEAVEETRVIEYKPIRNAGGWGFRWGRFEGGPARFFTVRGTSGVLVTAAGKRYIIGSQDPERLSYEIDRARGVNA